MLKSEIKFPLFNVTVLVVAGEPVLDILTRLNLEPDRSLETCDAVSTDFVKVDDVGFCCVVAFESSAPPIDIISHEAFHVVSRVCDHVGIEDRDEELLAYMAGFITGKIFDSLNNVYH